MDESYSAFLVVDLEATCDQDALPRPQREIIEIGAVLVDGQTYEAIGEFQTFVRPVRHPVLTQYCLELTTITQQQVDEAPTFAEALEAFTRFISKDSTARFCSWGKYDSRQLQQDCDYHGLDYPFDGHLDLASSFRRKQGFIRRLGLKEALERAGIPMVGTQHRGIDDARSLAPLIPWCLGLRKVADTTS